MFIFIIIHLNVDGKKYILGPREYVLPSFFSFRISHLQILRKERVLKGRIYIFDPMVKR
jgi:hypothetical protein